MKFLAIDSSGLVASVALLEEDTIVGQYTINSKQTHSQTLLPMIDHMLTMAGRDISEMDYIAVAAGPGSFTGLRIGAATAKGLAAAVNIPIVGVSTLEALAYHLSETTDIICPIMDARRSQVYTAVYSCEHGNLQVIEQPKARPVTEVIDLLNKLGKPVVFVGDAICVYDQVIQDKISVPCRYANAKDRLQSADCVALLGARYAAENKAIKAAEFAPEYLRLSQAERDKISTSKQ